MEGKRIPRDGNAVERRRSRSRVAARGSIDERRAPVSVFFFQKRDDGQGLRCLIDARGIERCLVEVRASGGPSDEAPSVVVRLKPKEGDDDVRDLVDAIESPGEALAGETLYGCKSRSRERRSAASSFGATKSTSQREPDARLNRSKRLFFSAAFARRSTILCWTKPRDPRCGSSWRAPWRTRRRNGRAKTASPHSRQRAALRTATFPRLAERNDA